MPNCPVCENSGATRETSNGYGGAKISCPRCGTFILTDIAVDDLPVILHNKPNKRMLLSHKILRSQLVNRLPKWDFDTCENVTVNNDLPNIPEQIDGTLEWIGNKSKFFGDSIDVSTPEIDAYAGVLEGDAIYECLRALHDRGLIRFRGTTGGIHNGDAQLTDIGWEKYDRMSRGTFSYDKAFMAMKFGDDELNSIVTNHFKPAVHSTGYKLFKLDDRPEAGLIDIRMRQEIKASKFIVADLTHENLGAYWEAGFAEGIGKKVIYTCKRALFERAKTHFDVNHHLTILWDTANPAEAAEQLKAVIRFTFPEAKQQD